MSLFLEQPQRWPLVERDVIGFVAFDLVAGIILTRMKSVTFTPDLLCVDSHDSTADAPGLRVPAHVIVDFELFHHGSSS